MAVNATQQQRADALLYWVNTFPLDSQVQSLQQLNDGHALAQVLADIDSTFHATELKNTSNASNWVPRWENLKMINKALSRYIREDCADSPGLALSQNLKRIAENADPEELLELLYVFLLASVLGPKTATYVPKIQDSEHAGMLAVIIQEKQAENEQAAAGLPHEKDAPVPSNTQSLDIELALEEKYGDLMMRNESLERENKRTKERNADLLVSVDRLRESNDDFKTKYLAAEDKSIELANRLNVSNPEIIKHLEDKIRDQDVLIASQERQIEDDRRTKTSLQRELEVLRPAAEDVKDLRAQVTEQEFEITELQKKANAGDRFKKKLESQKHLEPENTRLKTEVSYLSQESLALEKKMKILEASQEQYRSTLQTLELEVVESNRQKNTLDADNRHLRQQVERLKKQEELDSAIISDLQREKVSESPSNMNSPTKSSGMNLQAEIEEVEPSGPNLELEVSRLRHANELLRGGIDATHEKFDLEIALSDANRLRDTAQKKFENLFEEHVILQRQLSEIIEGRDKEGAELDKHYRDLSTRLAEEIQVANKRIEKLEFELGNKNRELLEAQAEFSMVDQNEIDKIEIVRSTNSSLVSNLQSDYRSLHARYQALVDESTIQKAQLTEALLSKDKIRNERDDLTNLVSTLQTSKPDGGSEEKEEQIKIQTDKIKELQDRLKNYVEKGNGNEIKTEKDEEILNLQRENKLMVTAWYDLTTRIQSNNVIVQRRSDARSWIRQARQAALGTIPRR